MDKRLRVLFLTAAPLAVGGLENHLLTLGAGLQDRFMIRLAGALNEPFRTQWEQLGLQAYHFFPRSAFDLRALRELKSVIRREQPDVLHIHDARAGLLARLAKLGSSVPVVVSVHYPSYQYVDRSPLRRRINAQVERFLNWLLTDAVVFPYRSTYHQALRRGIVRRRQARLIPSGIDVEKFVRAAQAVGGREKTCQGNSPEVCRLVLVSRLSPEKDVSLALKTTARLADQGYLVSLMVVGDGPSREALETEARQLGISGEVQFLGFRQDVPQLLAQSDILLMTSRFEAGPYVVMEAMAAGKPCVATPAGDVPWLLEDGAGVVVPERTPEAFAEAVAGLLEDEASRKRIGARAQKKAESEFSIESMIDGYSSLYQEIIGGGI